MAAVPAAQTTAELQDNNSTNASISVTQHCYQRAADKSHPQKPSFPQATQLPAPATISAYQTSRTYPNTFSSNNTAISISSATGNPNAHPCQYIHNNQPCFQPSYLQDNHLLGFTPDLPGHAAHAATTILPTFSHDIHPQTTTYGTFTSQNQNHPHPLQHHSPQRSSRSHPHHHQRSSTHCYQHQSYQHFFPQAALHNKGRLTPGLSGSHPGASKLTTAKHRRHSFRPRQRYPNKSHPRKHKSTPNTATSIGCTGTAPTSSPFATSNGTQTITPSQTHFPPTTLPPASVRSALFTAQHYCYQQHDLNKPHPHKCIFHKQPCYQHQSHQHCHHCYQHQSYQR